MPNLSFSFFGSGQILGPNDTEILLRGRKEFGLLAYLALESQSAHRREFLGGLLWPEMGSGEFRNNLRVTLSRVKHEMLQHGVDPLVIKRQTIQFRPSPDFAIDTNRFQQLKHEIDIHPHADPASCTDCFPKITQAVDLYRGEFLQGFFVDDSYAFDDWMTEQREYFHLQTVELLTWLEAAYIYQKKYREATTTVRRRVALDPLQEDAHRQLMRLMVQNGERHAALVQYETCRRLLEQELGVPPSDETAELYRQIRDGELSRGGPNGLAAVTLFSQTDSSELQSEASAAASSASLPGSPANSRKQATFEAQLTRWGTVHNQKLFGIEGISAELFTILSSKERPWIVSVDGIGGIGKTSIARELSRKLMTADHFERVAWVSAKQEEFHAESGIQSTARPALDADQMVTELLTQLKEGATSSGDATARRQTLIQHLKEEAALVVVDNLETVADYQALMPLLTQLAEPSKVLITSRLSLRGYPDIYARSLGELSQPDTFALLRYETNVRGIDSMSSATDAHLGAIYDVVGGHPLALNLVLGQLSYLPLGQVLTRLQEAKGERVEEIYAYIYWQAWQMLDDASRQLFLTLPIVYNGTFDQLVSASLLETDELSGALSQLIGLSLVQLAGDIMEPRYRLHRLTETFLMNEVLKWQLR